MQQIRRSIWSSLLKSRNGFSSNQDFRMFKNVSNLSLTKASPTFTARSVSSLLKKGSGNGVMDDRHWTGACVNYARSNLRVVKVHDTRSLAPSFSRTLASLAAKRRGDKTSKTRKEISKAKDPFDAPTYNIPEKPVTFVEGASYSVIILAGLGVAAAAVYAVCKEIIFEPKEYKVFNLALKRIQDDHQVRSKIGYPIIGYGQESRNRAARQRIPNKVWTDDNGVEHVEINFYIRGPHGSGKVYTEMFKDKEDRQWKYTVLVVEIRSPTQSNIILESYLPSLKMT